MKPPLQAACLLLTAVASCGCHSELGDLLPGGGPWPEPQRAEFISRPYEIDRIYRSMKGPWSQQGVFLFPTDAPETLWITAARVQMVAGDATTPMPPQFMCHANLDLNVKRHNHVFGLRKSLDGRLFTLSQGQLEVVFPPGFGIPVRSDVKLDLSTQVLNLNERDKTLRVRHRVMIDFVRDDELSRPMNPLFESGIFAMKSLEGRQLVYDVEHQPAGTDTAACKSCCLPGKSASHGDVTKDRHGNQFTGHWIVPPGREENRTRVTTLMGLPFDTTIHHIAVHLHPFAESLELIDLTMGETLFKSQARNFTDKIGLEHVDHYSSAQGIPVFRDHEYELVSRYNNTTDEDQDSMAVMYLYLLDKEFQRLQSN